MKKALLHVVLIVLMALSFASIALANGPFLNVDGVVYTPSQVSGPVNHYTTPDISPSSAFSDRHVWLDNGINNLPCMFGIHWVDNANVLTISHCLEGETSTTTTTPSTTTTTITESTTTTIPEETTTTIETTTTTNQESTTTTIVGTTTTVGDTTTTVRVPEGTLPVTGIGVAGLGLAAAASFLLGAILVLARRAY